MQPPIRTVSADPGLLTPEELLAQHEGGRRRTLEQLIEKSRELHIEKKSCNKLYKEKIRWFLDTARLRISVSPFNYIHSKQTLPTLRIS